MKYYKCAHCVHCNEVKYDGFFCEKTGYLERKRIVDKCRYFEVDTINHGRWVVKTIWYHRLGMMESECSECKFHLSGDLSNWKYCPNCGARMDGGDYDDKR